MLDSLTEIEIIQSLWSGYGQIVRMHDKAHIRKTYIVKQIQFPSNLNHPRGWNTNLSHERKVKSYQVEMAWYKQWASRCTQECYVPKCYYTASEKEQHQLVLEDLDALRYTKRRLTLNVEEAKIVLEWLANFHATFMNKEPIGLWEEGTYWHLKTRPDELEQMEKGVLKKNAVYLDQLLRKCKFKTIVHGDAKVANFCFSEDMKKVAAVDFQYVGGGCGMKDVSYFLGSCLSERECEQHETELLNYYFKVLKKSLIQKNKQFPYDELEQEWRALYSVAWADFMRFLEGWMPNHKKNNAYGKKMVMKATALLK